MEFIIIAPKCLVIWMTVESDKLKRQLENDKILKERLREILIKAGYHENSVDEVKLGFESEETVKRESNGDWYLHFR